MLHLSCVSYTLTKRGCLTILMFFCRYIIFDLQESSKYLVAQGRDEEAIAVLEYVARRNGRRITLTVEQLQACSPSKEARVKKTFMQSVMQSFTHFNLLVFCGIFVWILSLTRLHPFTEHMSSLCSRRSGLVSTQHSLSSSGGKSLAHFLHGQN